MCVEADSTGSADDNRRDSGVAVSAEHTFFWFWLVCLRSFPSCIPCLAQPPWPPFFPFVLSKHMQHLCLERELACTCCMKMQEDISDPL